ncbi:MAG: hypothetical protein IKN56_00820, partial [Clostridia bacterium]|nr:hypothetical protein [Clostridia bacterium]
MPSKEWNAQTHPYRAVSNGFRKAGTLIEYTTKIGGRNVDHFESVETDELDEVIRMIGSDATNGVSVAGEETAYFIGNLDYLTYVISGGNCNFTADNNAADITVTMNQAFYSGGFVNNNWFKNYVLEADGTEADGSDKYKFNVSVKTLTPDDPDLNHSLELADLIVITRGLDITKTNGYIAYDSDIPDDQLETIKSTVNSFIEQKMPVMVDYLLFSDENLPGNLKSLCEDVVGTMSGGGVKGSVYSFSSNDLTRTDSPVNSIANEGFLSNVPTGKFEMDGRPYFPVGEEIRLENVVRNGNNAGDLNQSNVTEATIIRYILNYKSPRNYGGWQGKKLLVLDIEPQSSKASITASKIKSLLPDKAPYNSLSLNDITIIPMSVAEFVAKNEDFSEIYDIVYIGSSTENMYTIPEEGNNSQVKFDYYYYTNAEKTAKAKATCTWVNGEPDATYRGYADSGMLVTTKLKAGS